MKNSSFIWACLFLFGCDSLKQEVDPRGLSSEPEKIVVACFISPQDTVLAARIGRSSTILGPDNQVIPDVSNAVVTLSDGTRSVVLKKTVNNLLGYTYYRARPEQIPVVVGKTYTLTVSVPNGQPVSASCTVPEPVAIGGVVIDSAITNEFGRVRKRYYARLRWTDPAGQVNYYRVAGNNEVTSAGRIQNGPNTPVRDTTFTSISTWYYENGSTLLDLGRDGQELISPRGIMGTPVSFVNGQSQFSAPRGKVTVYLLNVDENYYRYHDEVARQSKVRNNPFAEPVLIQTNIRDGLGCFGAYNKSTLTTQLK